LRGSKFPEPLWPLPQPVDGHLLDKLGLKHLGGPLEACAEWTRPPEEACPNALVFLGPKALLSQSPALLIVKEGLDWQSLKLPATTAVFSCSDLKQAMLQVLPYFRYQPPPPTWDRADSLPPSVSSQAYVSPTAKLGENVTICPQAFIGEYVRLGDRVWIGAGVVVEDGAVVEDDTRIEANSIVGHHCRIGKNCEIKALVSIGSDGFGFAPGARGPQRIEQVGITILEDGVRLGSHCSIDRATVGATVIGKNSKFDNHCHVAHNCRFGPNTLVAAGLLIAGSSTVGANCVIAGSVVITDHAKICDNVTLAGRSAVTGDVTKPGAYTGHPLEPLKDGLRTIANLRELTRLRRELAALKKERDPS
jgi:UDP-3-O-[3-hydroxymyristoyl] glucosamine N-acyltransferase